MDFETPPLIEVVCCVRFKHVEGFNTPHIGVLWQRFQPEFPECREAAPIFSDQKAELRLEPRWWFIADDQKSIVQISAERYVFNWKKVDDQDSYPRFPQVFSSFKEKLEIFKGYLKDSGLGPPSVVGFELAYVNHIPKGAGWDNLANIGHLFPSVDWKKQSHSLPEPSTINWTTGFKLPNNMGDLNINAVTANKLDGQDIIQLTLSVSQLEPQAADDQAMIEWFDNARNWIKDGFADLTSIEVQRKNWKKCNKTENLDKKSV